ncbi:iron complex transport system substrate-binding protein [Nocardioides zeae]|uniref:Iron complex transport system substrate-binding protein n=1 Tax=Nocardioides zeae TaxID=1457234 RepID=A0ACC6IE54_9ACTN|nr:iron-siderophore ABC transporter substrate-binding protein [Nocardioides zeae]MDR6174095.1 iron complex transport system substrate-binding protein [Nocardioides zeae]MDR6208902.1 iron complex transport system substrate-binding protein [Nocardioides zeae]
MSPSRPIRPLVAGLVLLPLIAACGTTDEAASSEGAELAEAGAFPATITHEFGTTTIEEEPQRIVTLGVTDADVVLALGKVPVGNTGYAFFDDGLGPWTDDLVEGHDLTFLESDSEPSLEKVASLDPDLIIGVSAGFDQATYDELAEIAPVVGRPAGVPAYTASREDAVELIATALGQPSAGERIVEETDAAIASARADHPELEGATGAAVLPYDGKYGAFLPGDARGQFLADLGVTLPEAVSERDTGDSFFVELSRENVGALDGDLLLVLSDDEDLDLAAENPLFASLGVVEDGGVVVATTDERGAITYNSPLSVPYAVENLVPRLAAAVS